MTDGSTAAAAGETESVSLGEVKVGADLPRDPQHGLDSDDDRFTRRSELRDLLGVSGFERWWEEVQLELTFHRHLLRESWTTSHLAALGFGAAALLLGTVDLTGELWDGGDPLEVGRAGISVWSAVSVLQVLLSMVCWGLYGWQSWGLFPTVRHYIVGLFLAWMFAFVGWVGLAGSDGMTGVLALGLCFLVTGSVAYAFHRAVRHTRNLHVEERHHDPDPRVMAEAMRDHSLVGWTFVFGAWIVAIEISALAAVQFVNARPHGSWFWFLLHLVSGMGGIWGMVHLLWFPQLMLGTAGETIETDASRKVARLARGEATDTARGRCPSCEAIQSIWRDAQGAVQIDCAVDGCTGHGEPGGACTVCETPIPTRHTCTTCGASAPTLDHLPDVEAW